MSPPSPYRTVRGRARIAGRLTRVPGWAGPGRSVLRPEIAEVSVEDLWGAEEVGPALFEAASC
ncbi:hypothetical protein QFZ58_005983 [Streptomyces sp. B1I3]|nr:hypothetical protein [Streptomyces sp. B1I3]